MTESGSIMQNMGREPILLEKRTLSQVSESGIMAEQLDRYEGEWQHDNKHGFGRFSWSNGDSYEGMTIICRVQCPGEYRHNKKHGKGTYTFGKGPWEGDSYSGDWQDDQKDGTGVYLWKVNFVCAVVNHSRSVISTVEGGRTTTKVVWGFTLMYM